ncbi:MAG: hypothetical protein AAF970_12700 [Bacteroidota bacterium]
MPVLTAATTTLPVLLHPSFTDVVQQGIGQVEGLLSFSDAGLTFTYETTSLINNVSPQATITLTTDMIRDVRLRRLPAGCKVVIYPRHIEDFEGVPGYQNGCLAFRLKRKHAKRAEALVEDLMDVLLLDTGLTTQARIPFQLPATNLGATEHHGLLYLDTSDPADPFLVFDLARGLSGGTMHPDRTIKLELDALAELRFTTGVLKDTLHVRPTTEALFEALPGAHRTAAKLSIWRRHRDAVHHLLGEIEARS